ncbi:PREDICTED: inositol-tetrakisphosphate 1-kinase 1-like [Nicotiana attenuata]|uniref:Inositol-tetrakisphosphate 1-kinase n=1 Tax=Nicotiana attenuata TaxID=49451 RepID=A0A1J6JSL6_NICAT|nr:PREDICTED: inositol-tetrakisphosphate 1-kinase 1-like [Nicotiana attenuata]OIT20730.1 inositol-tetrakisphosphate 1-kinase 1 [Nicotiana attenuata]
MSESVTGERFRIGYALAPRSLSSFIQDSLLIHAKEQGVDLIPIDLDKPLVEQGPFDSVFHKLYDSEWKKQLEEFSLKNPTSIIVDPIESIEKLHNRVSMLDVVSQLKMENLGIPLQAFVNSNDSESLLDVVTREGLKFPIIAKAMLANATADAHQMYLVLNKDGLNGIKPPIVLQEFVNHGGVIFKVYVAGDHVKCVKRKSLPDITEEKMENSESLIPFSMISYFADQEHNDESVTKMMEAAEMPPMGFINEVSNQLRTDMNLHLFNYDMIRDNRVGNRYLIIDINYFPGYAKVPEYETMLTPCFFDLAQEKRRRETGNFEKENKIHEADSNGQNKTHETDSNNGHNIS